MVAQERNCPDAALSMAHQKSGVTRWSRISRDGVVHTGMFHYCLLRWIPPLYPRHLYVHVPFCARRCSYCDFSIAVRSRVPVDEYVESVERELAFRFTSRPEGDGTQLEAPVDRWTLDTLYLGGGTPSRLGAAGVARLLETLSHHVTLEPNAEVTLEANPDDVSPDAITAWRAAGVTRISIGAQSFNDDALTWMHRTHDSRAISDAVAALRATDFTDYSLDLIFALPTMLKRDWRRDLDAAIALTPMHISLYGLTVEPMTPLGRQRARGDVTEAPDERYESEYLDAHHVLTAAGFDHYEVSNFGRPGHRARHNSAYWSGVPYAGIGPAAHEFTGAVRRWNVAPYAEWLRRLASGSEAFAGSEALDVGSRATEQVYLGLRTTDGVALGAEDVLRVRPWVEAGWGAIVDGPRLVLNAAGWLRLDSLAADLTHFRSH
jgi:oxygen-independent coproporphyrinogen III oxidase